MYNYVASQEREGGREREGEKVREREREGGRESEGEREREREVLTGKVLCNACAIIYGL